MDITKECSISAKHGFDSQGENLFVVLDVVAKNGDMIKINKIDGIRYNELLSAFESPKHEEHPIIDDESKIIVIGGDEKKSARSICVIGK
ncbi:MAG: hypothetical protein ABIH20_02690 [Candidatus Diapherotrites archaeon]